MKRGLKVRVGSLLGLDDQRTVATYAPMKRGLKVQSAAPVTLIPVATYAPMKRGLKAAGIYRARDHSGSSNLCPDEKGTESPLLRQHHRRKPLSSNLCPDEKGTESMNIAPRRNSFEVATYAPMKRGLKGTTRTLYHDLFS